jgi:hypothetical protein
MFLEVRKFKSMVTERVPCCVKRKAKWAGEEEAKYKVCPTCEKPIFITNPVPREQELTHYHRTYPSHKKGTNLFMRAPSS